MNPPRRVNGPPARRRRLPVQRLPVAAGARFPRGFQASAAWWGQPCAWNALATNAGSIPSLWSGAERSGVLNRFALWPSRHHRCEQAFVGRCERGRPSRGWLRTRRQARYFDQQVGPRWWMPSSMVLAQGTLRYRRRNATFGPKPCVVLAPMQGSLRYRRHNATFSPEPCVVLSLMQGTFHYSWRNATFGPKPCVVPVKRGARAYEPGKTIKGKCRSSSLALAHVADSRSPTPAIHYRRFPQPRVPCENQWLVSQGKRNCHFPRLHVPAQPMQRARYAAIGVGLESR